MSKFETPEKSTSLLEFKGCTRRQLSACKKNVDKVVLSWVRVILEMFFYFYMLLFLGLHLHFLGTSSMVKKTSSMAVDGTLKLSLNSWRTQLQLILKIQMANPNGKMFPVG